MGVKGVGETLANWNVMALLKADERRGVIRATSELQSVGERCLPVFWSHDCVVTVKLQTIYKIRTNKCGLAFVKYRLTDLITREV
jgi:hypothetical protein